MRELKLTLGGKELTLAINFKASQEITDKVMDPLVIARELQLDAIFNDGGLKAYQPKFRYTGSVVAQLLHIGVSHAGGDMSLDDMQELVLDAGLVPSRDAADRYLAMFLDPQSEELRKAKTRKPKAGTPEGE